MPRPGLGLFGLPGQLSETYSTDGTVSISLALLAYYVVVVTWTVCLGVAVCVFQCCPGSGRAQQMQIVTSKQDMPITSSYIAALFPSPKHNV